MKPYRLVDDLVRPVLRVGMPRAPRLIAPDTQHHVISSGLERGHVVADQQDRADFLAQLGLSLAGAARLLGVFMPRIAKAVGRAADRQLSKKPKPAIPPVRGLESQIGAP